MRILLKIGLLLALFTGCSDSKTGNTRSEVTNDVPENQDPKKSTKTESEKGVPNENSIIGEWSQQYAVLDQNGNAQLDPEDRNGTKSSMGFNYFQFNEDGTCLRDSDAKFRGNYEIVDEQGKRQLKVTVNGFGETYTYTIVDPVSSELTLYTSGVFLIYNRK
jgi:hypothetical protein